MTDTRLYVNGAWREGRERRGGRVVNPATEEEIGRVAHAGASDVRDAIDAAEAALPAWRRTSAARRGEVLGCAAAILAERKESAAVALTREQGKTLAESRAEMDRAIETLVWHADRAARLAEPRAAGGGGAVVHPEPIGVVGAFTPWNYPAVIIARKLGAALAAGCTVVLKAAEETPAIAAHIVAALEEAELPAGVVNLVFGDPPAIAEQVLDASVVRALSFTGSTAVGKRLAERAARRLVRCVLELGGHAPVLVFADAGLDAAVASIAAYKFECAGQSCNAPSRIYVERPLYEPFVHALADVARALRVGDGMDARTDMGPMANARRVAAMERLTSDARARGATVVTGGGRPCAPGWFWSPTVLADVPDGAAVLAEEPFGPIVPVSPFDTADEAIALANATPYGLAAYVFTRSEAIAERATRELEAGSVGVNELRGVPPDVGIAGVKESGYGYEGGGAGVEEFVNLKVVRGTGLEDAAVGHRLSALG